MDKFGSEACTVNKGIIGWLSLRAVMESYTLADGYAFVVFELMSK